MRIKKHFSSDELSNCWNDLMMLRRFFINVCFILDRFESSYFKGRMNPESQSLERSLYSLRNSIITCTDKINFFIERYR